MGAVCGRELSYRDDAGREHVFAIAVHPPRPDGECWACEYEIGGPMAFTASAYGEDSLQALVMALHAVQAHLNAPALRGRVRWLGEPLAEFMALPSL